MRGGGGGGGEKTLNAWLLKAVFSAMVISELLESVCFSFRDLQTFSRRYHT